MITIHSLELENVKRVHHVQLEPKQEGLTIIGGKNSQGKTSILDAIAWALGGDKFKPKTPQNDDAMTPPRLRVELSNGLIVERKGSKSALYVTDPSGQKAGQTLLDSFVEKLAIDLPKFLESSDKEKANTLLQIIGVGEQLAEFEKEEARLYNERLLAGRVADSKKHHAEEMGAYYEEVPEEPISPAALIKQQSEILRKNAENQRMRDEAKNLATEYQLTRSKLEELLEKQKELTSLIKSTDEKTQELQVKLKIAKTNAEELQDESTEELENNLANIEEINEKIAFNKNKKKAEEEAAVAQASYDDLNLQIEQIRSDKRDLLNGADLPLKGLSVENGLLTFNGHGWSDMSSSEQLRVAVAIVRKLKPECGFILMDKLEQFDLDTLADFGTWAEENGLQIIATKVTTGPECQLIIEDGYAKEPEAKPTWTAGKF